MLFSVDVSYCDNLGDGGGGRENMSDVKHNEKLRLYVLCLTSKQDMYELEVDLTRIPHQTNETFKSSEHH